MITAEQLQQLRAWFAERLPVDVYESLDSVTADREEITVVGVIPADESVKEFRERTREQRIEVAREAEELYRRKVAWGVRAGEETTLFTHLAVPAMTRLRQSERQVLDTLVAAWRGPQPGRRPRLVRPARRAQHRRVADGAARLPGPGPAGPRPGPRRLRRHGLQEVRIRMRHPPHGGV